MACSAIFAQDSMNSIQNLFNSTTASSVNIIVQNPLSLQNQLAGVSGKSKLGIANQPIFVNSERPMIDGTTWRKYSEILFEKFTNFFGQKYLYT